MYYTVQGTHNDIRPKQLYEYIIQFFIDNFNNLENS